MNNFPFTIVNVRRYKPNKNEAYVYCGRPSKWGNPFVIGRDGNRNTVIEKYRQWVLTQPHLLNSLHELDEKICGCYCAPQRCHLNVLQCLRIKQIEGELT